MKSLTRFQEIITQLLTPEQFLVAVQSSQRGSQPLVEVLVDTDAGITISECAELSRKLNAWLEENDDDLMQEAYILEVSSPGIDFPLTTYRQFKKNVGRRMTVTLTNETQITGTLKEAQEDHILIAPDAEKQKKGWKQKASDIIEADPQLIKLTDITDTKILLSFK